MPMIFLRRDGFTNSASMEEIVSMAKNNKGLAFDMQDTDIDFKLSDFSKLASFYKEHTNKDITEKGLASIGFFNDKGKLRRGALLFRDDYKGEDSKITCMNFAGLSRGGDLVLSSNSFTGNLIDAYSFIWEFLQ